MTGLPQISGVLCASRSPSSGRGGQSALRRRYRPCRRVADGADPQGSARPNSCRQARDRVGPARCGDADRGGRLPPLNRTGPHRAVERTYGPSCRSPLDATSATPVPGDLAGRGRTPASSGTDRTEVDLTLFDACYHRIEVAALDRDMHEVVGMDARDAHQLSPKVVGGWLDIEGYLLGSAEAQAATSVPDEFQITLSFPLASDSKLTSQLASFLSRGSFVSCRRVLGPGAGS